MWIIFKYSARQIFNYWKFLPLRIKIEIILLLAIFYVYVTDQLVQKFRYLLELPDITPLGLSVFLQGMVLSLILAGIPFIYFSLIPRQKSLQLLRRLPLSSSQSAVLLLVHLWKYELIYLIIIVPLATAVGITLGPGPLIYLLLLLFLMPSLSLLLLHILSAACSSPYRVLFIYLFLAIVYSLLLGFLYYTRYYIVYQLVVIILLSWLVYLFWPGHWEKWDIVIDRFRPVADKLPTRSGAVDYSTLAHYLPRSIRPILAREILVQLRNGKYLRLKILTLLFFLLGTWLLLQYGGENFSSLLAMLVIILIWWHYSSQFNEKYVIPESKFFLKTMPLRYYQFFLPKFLAELNYICFLSLVVIIIFLLHGENWKGMLLSIFSMFIVSIFILLTTIIFKTMLYDKPRLAGYAYHLLLLFCLVMSVNYYFIGPVITIALLLYFSYKSYQAFSS